MAADTELRPLMDTSLNIVRALKQLRDIRSSCNAWPQTEVTLDMRETVAEWLQAVCEEEAAAPELFCLAVQVLDEALARIPLKGAQLQLLAASCLLVSWKVRECRPISAVKIVKYTNYSVQLETLLEWEVYVLAKLNWNVPGLVATDFVDHILKHVGKLRAEFATSEARARVISLICQSQVSWRLARLAPSVLAAASVIVGLQPEVTESPSSILHTPSSSLSSNTSSPEMSARILTPSSSSKQSPFRVSESPIARIVGTDNSVSVSSPDLVIARTSDMERLVRSVQRITFVDKVVLQKAREELQSLANTPKLAPSPEPGHCDTSAASGGRVTASSPMPIAARSLFKDLEVKTPTKILEASTSITDSC